MNTRISREHHLCHGCPRGSFIRQSFAFPPNQRRGQYLASSNILQGPTFYLAIPWFCTVLHIVLSLLNFHLKHCIWRIAEFSQRWRKTLLPLDSLEHFVPFRHYLPQYQCASSLVQLIHHHMCMILIYRAVGSQHICHKFRPPTTRIGEG